MAEAEMYLLRDNNHATQKPPLASQMTFYPNHYPTTDPPVVVSHITFFQLGDRS